MKYARPFYHEFAWAYDLLLDEPILARIEFIDSVLGRNGVTKGSRVLDAGCGTGRYAVELSRRGYRVWGIDQSPELIAIARTREANVNRQPKFLIADLLNKRISQRFDAILCRGVLNDFVGEVSRSAIFRHFALWLRTGGILIFDVREWARTADRYKKNAVHRRTVKLTDGELHFLSETTLDERSRRLLVHERFDSVRQGQRMSAENDLTMQAWTLEEIAAHLGAAGFDEVETHMSYGESDLSWSDRVVVIAREK